MNKILTFQGQQPLYLGDIDFAESAVREALQALLEGLTGGDPANAILSGVVGAQRSGSVAFTGGVVSIDGEVLPVDEGVIGGASLTDDTFYFRIKSAYSGNRTFKNLDTHYCWETRSVEVTTDETEYPMASFRRLRGGVGSQTWRRTSSSESFALVKTGVVWMVSLYRVAMTAIESHLFDITIPGIQADDLEAFPTSEALTYAVATIVGSDGATVEPVEVRYQRSSGSLHIQMDLASGEIAAGSTYLQVVLPVF